jgi:hypothetical protein
MIDGMTNFFVNTDNRLKSSVRQQTRSMVRVPVSSAETILRDAGVREVDVGLIWIDIEGYEAIACLSMVELMTLSTPVYMVVSPEFSPRDQGSSLIRYLATYYRRCVVLNVPSPHIMPVSDIPLNQGTIQILLID